MVTYAVWAIDFKSDFRFDLRGCLEAMVSSKPHFEKLYLKSGSFSNKVKISPKILLIFSKNSPKIFINHPKIKFSISLRVSRRYIRSEPCLPKLSSPGPIGYYYTRQFQCTGTIMSIFTMGWDTWKEQLFHVSSSVKMVMPPVHIEYL